MTLLRYILKQTATRRGSFCETDAYQNKPGWLGWAGKLAALDFIHSDNFTGGSLNGWGNGNAPRCIRSLLPSGMLPCSSTNTGTHLCLRVSVAPAHVPPVSASDATTIA